MPRSQFHSWCSLFQRVLVAVLLGAAALASAAPHPPLDVAQASASPTSLTPWFELLEDPQGMLTLEQVRSPELAAQFTASANTTKALNFGITPSAWWLRLRLANSSNAPVDRLLEVAYARRVLIKITG